MKKVYLLCATILIVALASAQVNLSNGLVAYYPFTGNALDSSGNGNNPSYNNATLTTDRFGNANSAYLFNGTNSYMQIPASSSLNSGTQLSISLWMKANGYCNEQCTGNYVLCKGTQTQTGVYDVIFSDAPYGGYAGINFCSTPVDTSHESFYGAGIGTYTSTTPVVKTNQWYHVVYVYNGDSSYLYINNVLASTGINPTTFSTTNDLFLGRYDISQTLPYWFNGTLDDIRIYNRALDTAEVTALYNAPNPVQTVTLSNGLMAYYPFTGNALDSSGNGNNPSYNNATLTTDRFGNANSAYLFNGTNSYMQIPASSSLNSGTQLSISLWMKANGYCNEQCTGNYVLCKGTQTQTGVYDVIFSDAPYGGYAGINFCSTPVDTSHESFYGAGIGTYTSTTPVVKTNQWYHVVYVYNGDSSYLYINNVLASTGINPTTFSTTNDLFLGRYDISQTLPYWFNGTLDDIRIYNRALDSAEIVALYTAPNNTPLPITLQSFTASAITFRYTSIQIATTNETNAAGIEIERSYDGTNFYGVDSLAAKGNVSLNQYSFTDKVNPDATTAYYRLKLINKDGTYQYSAIVTVQLSVNHDQISIYPNPAKKFIMVNGKNINEVNIIDNLGRVVLTKKGLNVSSSLNKVEFNLSQGVYIAQLLTADGKIVNEKFVVQ